MNTLQTVIGPVSLTSFTGYIVGGESNGGLTQKPIMYSTTSDITSCDWVGPNAVENIFNIVLDLFVGTGSFAGNAFAVGN